MRRRLAADEAAVRHARARHRCFLPPLEVLPSAAHLHMGVKRPAALAVPGRHCSSRRSSRRVLKGRRPLRCWSIFHAFPVGGAFRGFRDARPLRCWPVRHRRVGPRERMQRPQLQWPQLCMCWPLRRRCRCACVRCGQNSADSRARVSRCRRRCRRSWLIVTAQTHRGVSRRASRCAGAVRRLRWRRRSLLLQIEDDGLGIAAEAPPLVRLVPRSCRPTLCGGIDALLQHGVNRVVVLQLARADCASATDPLPVDKKPEARNR